MNSLSTTDWKTVALGDVCLIDKAKYKGAPAPYVGLEKISNNTGEYLGDFNPTSVKSATFQFDKRHLLYGRLRPYLNKALTPDFEGHCSSEIFPLRPKEGLDRRYLFYWLTSDTVRKSIEATSTGARMPRANMNEVMRFHMPLPPLGEQRRIVAVLDEAFEGLDRARAHVQANLQDTRELFDSTVNRVFVERGWCTATLDALAHKDCSLSYGIVQPGDEVPDGLPLVRPTNLIRRTVDLGGLKRIDPDRAASYGRTTLVGGELLLCVRGSTGTVSLAAEELRGGNVTRGIVPVRFDPSKIDIRFAYYQFLSKYVQNQIAEKTYGAALMQINIGDLRKLNIFEPSLEEQYSEVGKLEAIEREHDHLCRTYQKRLVDLAELRQSIFQRAFAGELT